MQYVKSHDAKAESRKAFTLIELLVVISIIALLISILLPSLRSVRDTAKITACSSNLHQLSVGHHSYAADNDGEVAPSNYGKNSPYNFCGVGTTWIKGGYANPGGAEGVWIGAGLLYELDYLSSGEVLYDPACENEGFQYDNPNVGFRGGTPWLKGNRWMNNNYIQRASIGSQNNGIPNTVSNPDSGNGRQVHTGKDSSGVAFMIGRPDFAGSPDGQQSGVDWTHVTGYNVLYADGAVNYVKLQGVTGQTVDPAIAGSESLTIPNYIKAMGITSFKYKPKELEKLFYYKLDKDNPKESPAP